MNGSPNLPSQWLDEIFAIEVAGDGVVLDDELRVDGKRVMWVFSAADSWSIISSSIINMLPCDRMTAY